MENFKVIISQGTHFKPIFHYHVGPLRNANPSIKTRKEQFGQTCRGISNNYRFKPRYRKAI